MKKNKIGNEVLKEQYEDSLFALLMDEFSITEGKKLIDENETLKNDTEFILPEGLEARCEKTISDTFAAKKRKETGNKAKKILSRVAMVILICGIVFVTLFSTVSAFREAVYSVVTSDKGAKTDFLIQDTKEKTVGENNVAVPTGAYLPTWLPDGFVLSYYNVNSEHTIILAEFSNKKGDIIRYNEYANQQVLGVDTENADSTENIKINKYDGMIAIKEDKISITWDDSDRNIIARISSKSFLDKESISKIAESVKIY